MPEIVRGNELWLSESLSSPKIKNISLSQNSDFRYTSPRPVPLRRGVAHRHETLGAGCDGCRRRQVGDPPTKRLPADGEVVWSWRRDPGVNRPCLCGSRNGDNKGRSPGRARISRKTIARGKPGCPGCTCQTRVRCCQFFAHGAAGAVGARLSLRPLNEEGAARLHNPGDNESRE